MPCVMSKFMSVRGNTCLAGSRPSLENMLEKVTWELHT